MSSVLRNTQKPSKSLGDMSNAETVFRESADDEDEEYEEDDDVSRLSGEDDFDAEEDDDEHTVHDEYKEYSDDDDEEMEDMEDGDSAFSTKSGLEDLKRRGRKVRRDSDAAFCSRIAELEEKKRQAEERMAQRVKEMEAAFEDNMNTVMARLKRREEEPLEAVMANMSVNQSAKPEAAGKDTKEGESSPTGPTGGAPAGDE